MAKCDFLIRSVLILTATCLTPVSAVSVIPFSVQYESPMGDENWHMSGNRIRCSLALTIPNFGNAYFEQYAAKQPHFIMTKWEQLGRSLPAIVFAEPPVWKPHGAVYSIIKTTVNPGEYVLYMAREPTIKTLSYLAQGYQTQIQYRSEEGFDISVILSPIRFQKPYAHFQKCLGNLLGYDYQSVALSVFLFNVDSFELNDVTKSQLNKIAEYYRADNTVKKIRIEGYTDDSGRKSYNNAVSEGRAKAVKMYLMTRGIQEDELFVTWFGVKKPVQPNNTEEGRAANRRVVVKLIK